MFLFLFGGCDASNKNLTNDVYKINLHRYDVIKLTVGGTPPTPRVGTCVWTVEDDKVLVFGGSCRTVTSLKDDEQYHKYNDTYGTVYRRVQR